jgi:TolB-like protein/Flp pilus assembly protein TadD
LADPTHAVFLSYASEDAAAAERIAAALGAAGIEVWFDKSELRGGDAWDHSIRRQIRSCALFIPVISRNTDARAEGYFRLEWKLAVDRSHLFTDTKAFLVPVAIDDAPDDDEHVPERFRELQWTRLPGGETPPAFVERLRGLLSGGVAIQIRSRERAPAASPPRRLLPAAAGGVVAAAVLVALGWVGIERLRASKPAAEATSIAVLPLANESGDPGQQYFSDGISEDLISTLGQFPGLKVIGRTSSFQFRDSKEDSRSIGAKLGVTHLLEGSVRRAGDMVRVSAELIDAADGSMQWSEHYDRPYRDLFALQDQITRAVAGSLKAKLLPGERSAAQSERPPSGSLEAYNAVLQGQFYYPRGTEAEMRKAIGFFAQATELDPDYAFAWSWLSQSWTFLAGGYLEGVPAQEAYAKARAAADRALALSPDLGAAHIARGLLLQNGEFDWRGAEAEFRRATELAPQDAYAKFYLGTLLASFGEVEQAIELTHQALAAEPLRSNWHNWLGLYFSGTNRLDEAERAVRKAIELQLDGPAYHQTLGVIEIQRGNAEAALAEAERESPGVWRDLAFALARQIGADRGAADAALKTLIDKHAGVAAYQIAEVYALRNDADATFAQLDRAWKGRDPGIADLLFDPFILRFRDDPRFAAFCHKVGLPAPGEITHDS